MKLFSLRSLTLFSSAVSFRIQRCSAFYFPHFAFAKQDQQNSFRTISAVSRPIKMSTSSSSRWEPDNPIHAKDARDKLNVWPLDEYNAVLLNEVHPRDYTTSTDKPHEIYDLIAIGAGAGGLVSSKQSARRGAKSCMISEHLAGGDCKYFLFRTLRELQFLTKFIITSVLGLNVGCVPSKGMLRDYRESVLVVAIDMEYYSASHLFATKIPFFFARAR